MERSREIVVDITDSPERSVAVVEAGKVGATGLLVRGELPAGAGADGFFAVALSGGDVALTDPSKPGGPRTAVWIEVHGPADVQKGIDAAKSGHGRVIVRCNDWKVIPLENLIAAFNGTASKLLAYIDSRDEARLAFSVLEKGVDGIVVPAAVLPSVDSELLSFLRGGRRKLTPAVVTRVADIGMGDRACVDTTSMLEEGEGMLVGSKSDFFFLVHSETIRSEYIPTRPFRVNAGAVHSYLLGEGRTSYLSELRAGMNVQAVSKEGATRTVSVGRVKLERRPMTLVEAEAEGRSGSIILQKAETVRLVTPGDSPVAVTDLKVGDRVLVHAVDTQGRHFGMEIDEFLLEC
ncbi:MAG: 3-dehydroquinate synthase [Nitrososphaerota archaeon]|nr:3-dehydroquinate synthase [Nitrososphaerota archaeon]MDG6938821.1 3-dehydroquinate synthase [Nitrososphaerota archaeon]